MKGNKFDKSMIVAGLLLILSGCTSFHDNTKQSSGNEVTDKILKPQVSRPAAGESTNPIVKKCSVCGREFPYSLEYCPYDGTELK